MSDGIAPFLILFLFFFVLPAVLYAVGFVRHAHEAAGDQQRVLLRLLGQICISMGLIIAARFALLFGLYAWLTDGHAAEAVLRTSWTLLPELIWLFSRVEAMVEELRISRGVYRERVVAAFLGRYTRWIIRSHALIAAAAVAAMSIVAVLLRSEFDNYSLEEEPIRWTVAAGLGVAALVALLLTKFTEPVTPAIDPTTEVWDPIPPSTESGLPNRNDIDAQIEDWRRRR